MVWKPGTMSTLADTAQRVYTEHNPGMLPPLVRQLLLRDIPDALQHTASLEHDNARLRSLLADAERIIMDHHSVDMHRAAPGDICQVCASEHEAVQAIWKELHET